MTQCKEVGNCHKVPCPASRRPTCDQHATAQPSSPPIPPFAPSWMLTSRRSRSVTWRSLHPRTQFSPVIQPESSTRGARQRDPCPPFCACRCQWRRSHVRRQAVVPSVGAYKALPGTTKIQAGRSTADDVSSVATISVESMALRPRVYAAEPTISGLKTRMATKQCQFHFGRNSALI